MPLPGTTGLTVSDKNFSTLRDHSYITINTKEADITNDMVKLHGILYRNAGKKNYLIHPDVNIQFIIVGHKIYLPVDVMFTK